MNTSRSHRMLWLVACVTVAVALALVGCAKAPTVPTEDATGNGGTGGSTQPTITPTQPADDGSATDVAPPAAPITLKVYFARGEKLGVVTREVPATKAVATAAMKELLKGTNNTDELYGMHTEIPQNTTLNLVSVKDKVATVDLSGAYDDGGGTLSMSMRLAQVVFTLTQFSTIDGVVFELDGERIEALGGEGLIIEKPQRRADSEDMLPAIFVENPVVGATGSSPLRVTGTANVFEATFQAEVRDAAGKVLAKKTVTATSGTGTRGTFDVTIPYTSPRQEMGALVVFEYSAKDGTPINTVSIPVKLMQ
ncbi:MAG: Gmad2 immunoglobulin-like domain-containing protein [Coriobacteriia bacterium]